MGMAVAFAIHISDRGDVVMDRLNVHGFQEADASPLTQISLSFPVRRGGVGWLSIHYLPPQKISTVAPRALAPVPAPGSSNGTPCLGLGKRTNRMKTPWSNRTTAKPLPQAGHVWGCRQVIAVD